MSAGKRKGWSTRKVAFSIIILLIALIYLHFFTLIFAKKTYYTFRNGQTFTIISYGAHPLYYVAGTYKGFFDPTASHIRLYGDMWLAALSDGTNIDTYVVEVYGRPDLTVKGEGKPIVVYDSYDIDKLQLPNPYSEDRSKEIAFMRHYLSGDSVKYDDSGMKNYKAGLEVFIFNFVGDRLLLYHHIIEDSTSQGGQ